MANAKTYTIHLCKNGTEFKCLPDMVDDGHPRPSEGVVIEEKWKVRGVIRRSVSELVVDVEEV